MTVGHHLLDRGHSTSPITRGVAPWMSPPTNAAMKIRTPGVFAHMNVTVEGSAPAEDRDGARELSEPGVDRGNKLGRHEQQRENQDEAGPGTQGAAGCDALGGVHVHLELGSDRL